MRAKLTVQNTGISSGARYDGIFDCLRDIGRDEGVRGLFKGLAPTLLTIAPFLAVQQTTYDMLRFKTKEVTAIPTLPLFFLCGISAGAFA